MARSRYRLLARRIADEADVLFEDLGRVYLCGHLKQLGLVLGEALEDRRVVVYLHFVFHGCLAAQMRFWETLPILCDLFLLGKMAPRYVFYSLDVNVLVTLVLRLAAWELFLGGFGKVYFRQFHFSGNKTIAVNNNSF